MRSWTLACARAGALVVAGALAAPVAAGADIFAWRTEDGVFAYTDDRDNIPARYAGEAVAVRDRHLGSYRRLTVEDSEATRAVASRLERRLDYLRQVNAPRAAHAAEATATAPGRTVVSVATGSPQVPTLDIVADEDAAPIVVEPILTKESGKSRTRRATVVKQGDRTLAVVKGRSHHHNVNEDIHDEEKLVSGR